MPTECAYCVVATSTSGDPATWDHAAVREEHERELDEAAQQYLRATEDLERARERLKTAIQRAYSAGMRQSEILRATRHIWSREYIRKVLGLTRRDGPAK
jgi:hypothetical protein